MSQPTERDGPDRTVDDAAQDWFLRLSSARPTPEDLACFAAWRDADPRHRAAYGEIREIWDAIGGLEPAFAPAKPVLPARRTGFRRTVLGGLAAACGALLVLVSLDLPVLLTADHSTGVGERRTIALPDGSIAHLNTGSAISIDYSDGRRRIALLRGEAMFEVAEDPGRPFDVTALDGRSTAVGTAFVVRERGDTATVTVTEGTVRVASPAGREATAPHRVGTPVTLVAGDRVSYRRGAAPGSVDRVDTASATAWRKGSIAIDGLPLAEAVAEIDRYRAGRIVLLADTAGLEPVTARASLHALDGAVRALAATHGLTVLEVGDYLTIVR